MTPAELKKNRKYTISAGPGTPAYHMVLQHVASTAAEFKLRHSGPIGGDAFTFNVNIRGDEFFDGTGKKLYVERFAR